MSNEYDDLLADFLGTPKKDASDDSNLGIGKVLEACRMISGSEQQSRVDGLKMLKQAIAEGCDLNERDASNFRGVDLLARGLDSSEAAVGVEWMAEADFAEQMMSAPVASEMPPMMAACYFGNPSVVDKFLELGMEGDVIANAPKQQIIGGTPFHAAVAGYRQTRQNDYVAVFHSLFSYCPDGINVVDRMKQRPIDLAMKKAVASGDKVLIVTMMNYGVEFDGKAAMGAEKLMGEIMKKEKDCGDGLKSLISANEAMRVVRELDGLTRGDGPKF